MRKISDSPVFAAALLDAVVASGGQIRRVHARSRLPAPPPPDGRCFPIVKDLAVLAVPSEPYRGDFGADLRETTDRMLATMYDARGVGLAAVTAIIGDSGAADRLAIDIDAAGDGWVRLTCASAPVPVVYSAGMATTYDQLPEPIRLGIERLEAYLEADGEPEDVPTAVVALWRPWRRLRLK